MLKDVLDKLKEPLLPIHLLNFFLSTFILGSVTHSYLKEANGAHLCEFNKDNGICKLSLSLYYYAYINTKLRKGSFSTWISTLTMLIAIVCIGIEIKWEKFSSHHRYIYLSEMLIGCLAAFIYFVMFILLASSWGSTGQDIKDRVSHRTAISACLCSFLSIISWGALGYVSYKGYKEDDLGGIERLGGYMDPVTSSYHGSMFAGSDSQQTVP